MNVSLRQRRLTGRALLGLATMVTGLVAVTGAAQAMTSTGGCGKCTYGEGGGAVVTPPLDCLSVEPVPPGESDCQCVLYADVTNNCGLGLEFAGVPVRCETREGWVSCVELAPGGRAYVGWGVANALGEWTGTFTATETESGVVHHVTVTGVVEEFSDEGCSVATPGAAPRGAGGLLGLAGFGAWLLRRVRVRRGATTCGADELCHREAQ